MRWDWDYEGFDALLAGPEMEGLMGELVRKGEQAAIVMAPERTGNYKRSFETETGVGKPAPAAAGGPRAYGKLRNTDPAAAAIEYGNNHNHQAHYVLTRAVDFMRE
jgi:hypothetical protein